MTKAGFSSRESGQEVEGFAILAEPARSLPRRAHDDIGALLQNMRQRIRMHVSAIGDGDVAFGVGHAVEPLAALLIDQLDEAETFLWKVDGAVKPP